MGATFIYGGRRAPSGRSGSFHLGEYRGSVADEASVREFGGTLKYGGKFVATTMHLYYNDKRNKFVYLEEGMVPKGGYEKYDDYLERIKSEGTVKAPKGDKSDSDGGKDEYVREKLAEDNEEPSISDIEGSMKGLEKRLKSFNFSDSEDSANPRSKTDTEDSTNPQSKTDSDDSAESQSQAEP